MDGNMSRTAAAAAVNATFLPLRPCLSSPLLLLGVDDGNRVWWKLIAPAIMVFVTEIHCRGQQQQQQQIV